MSFEDRLRSVEDDFLSALTQGEEAIVAFNTRWEGLLQEVNAALDNNLLDDTTSILAHTTALRVAALAETSASLFTSCDDLTVQFMDQIDSLMSQLDISGHRHSQDDSKPLALSPSLSLDPPSPSPRSTRGTKRTRGPVDTPSPCKRRRQLPSGHCSKVVPVWQHTPADLPSKSTPGSSTSREVDVVPHSRKRRLSDAAINPSPSPSKRLYVGPRLHSVSDSFAIRPTPQHIPSSPSSVSAHHSISSSTPAPGSIEVHDLNRSSSRTESTDNHILALPRNSTVWSGHLSSTFADIWPSLVPTTVFDNCASPLTYSSETESVPPSALDDNATSSALSSPYPTTPPPLDFPVDPPHYCSIPLSDVSVIDDGLNPDYIPPPSFDEGLGHASLDGPWSSMLGIWDPSAWLAIPPPPYQLSSSTGFTLTKLNSSGSLDLTSWLDLSDSGPVELDMLDCGIRNAPLAALT